MLLVASHKGSHFHSPATLFLGKELHVPVQYGTELPVELVWTFEKEKFCCLCWELNRGSFSQQDFKIIYILIVQLSLGNGSN